MAVTTEMIKALREETGAGVMDAKRALDSANGDVAKAKAILREQGVAAAAKRAERETSNGVVDSYIHSAGRIGVLVEVTARPTSWRTPKTSADSRGTSRCRSPR